MQPPSHRLLQLYAATALLEALQPKFANSRGLQAALQVLEVMRSRQLPGPNIDFALAALARSAHMIHGASEGIMAIARSAGWIAHALRNIAHRARSHGRPCTSVRVEVECYIALMSKALKAEVTSHLLPTRDSFPNNAKLPALHYLAAFPSLPVVKPAAAIERVFARNGWSSGWRDGVYNYHHYHTTAHEVLGCYAGRALIQLGGPQGPVVEFKRGDVLVLPAGVAHKSADTSKDFSVVGAYAQGRAYDMKRANAEDLAAAEHNIAAVPAPEHDPVYGADGPLTQHWTA